MQQRAISASNRSRDVMPAFSDRSPVGVIGLGLLGEALARRLIGAGFPVRGYDLDPAKNASFESLGGRAANSPAAVAASCDCIYLAVGSNNHLPPWGARENLLGTNPIAIAIPALEEPPVVLDMAPCCQFPSRCCREL
jgi:phosphoglycerate dehydrogenase-like enzyme